MNHELQNRCKDFVKALLFEYFFVTSYYHSAKPTFGQPPCHRVVTFLFDRGACQRCSCFLSLPQLITHDKFLLIFK